ncbi:tubulin-tyrosine ligase-like protein [Trypanosoma rangeli SC58]|uniref:Tubulin-tyrosine ligase-like protein n=1 Tax=Trypanosoma rangeli SC58 TaxID=429131 RepID=A0A061J4U4_TRYRA|nr:tubulin-tyrosine ligase-like protein [Trypanosoma rangeli SC58]
MCQPLAAQNVTGTKCERGTDITSSTSTPATNSLPQQQVLRTSSSLTGGTQEQVVEVADLIEERRACEDAKLCNFRRIYPTTDAQHQLVYDAILAQARTQFGSPRPSWVSSPAPTSPQTTEERYRRFDALSAGRPTPPRAAFGTSLRDRSALPTPCEPASDVSINSLSNISTYSMGQQMQRLCEDMKLSQCRGKLTPRAGSFFSSAVGSKSSVRNNNQHPIDEPSDPTSLTGTATTNLAPERKRPVLGRISMGTNAEGPLRKPHIINTKLAPCGSPSITPVGNPPPTMERLEEMRSLQERLDQEAECELSPSHDSAEGSSFVLEEEE